MRLTAAVCVLLATQVVVEARKLGHEPSEEAPYTVVKENEGYEERSYPASPWVCNSNTLQEPRMSSSSFWPLFGYISGGNMERVTIPMTAPVTNRLRENTEDGTWDSQMCFYIPEAHQENPPQPNSRDVEVVDRPAMNVFARRTGGNLTTEGWMNLVNELKSLLSNEPTADLSMFYTVGYDSPRKKTDRRNEVWFQKA